MPVAASGDGSGPCCGARWAAGPLCRSTSRLSEDRKRAGRGKGGRERRIGGDGGSGGGEKNRERTSDEEEETKLGRLGGGGLRHEASQDRFCWRKLDSRLCRAEADEGRKERPYVCNSKPY